MGTPQEQLELIRKYGIEDDFEGAIKIKDALDEDGLPETWNGSVDAATVEWLISENDRLRAACREMVSCAWLQTQSHDARQVYAVETYDWVAWCKALGMPCGTKFPVGGAKDFPDPLDPPKT
jgi:hypothetical protein